MTATYGTRTLIVEPAPGQPEWLLRVVGEDCPYEDLRGLSCDYVGCFAAEWEDIVRGTSDELRPIYLDTRDGVCMCQECLDAGKHLEPEGEG